MPVALVARVVDLDQVRAMLAQRHPWFAGLTHADLNSLPTGHWPMLSEPVVLTAVLDRATA